MCACVRAFVAGGSGSLGLISGVDLPAAALVVLGFAVKKIRRLVGSAHSSDFNVCASALHDVQKFIWRSQLTILWIYVFLLVNKSRL